jgi:hypothetical protein
VITNRRTPDSTINFLAAISSQEIAEIIAVNQERMLRFTPIIDSLLSNPLLTDATRYRLEEFKQEITDRAAGRFGPRPAEAPAAEAPAAAVEEPPVLPEFPELQIPEISLTEDVDLGELDLEQVTDLDLGVDADQLSADIQAELEYEALDAMKKIALMSMSEKLQLARKGSIQERVILIRDPNKEIAMAVIQSPKLTDYEVERISNMRTVPEEVLRYIGAHKEWVGNYNVVRNLVKNAKTPIGISLGFIKRLNEQDLKDLERSRDVPAVITAQARRTIEIRRQRRTGKYTH